MKLNVRLVTKTLAGLPPDGDEERYFKGLSRILRDIELPKTEANGLALIVFLEPALVHLDDGTVVGVNITPLTKVFGLGSKECLGRGIAAAFSNVNSDPIWWKANAVYAAERPEVKQAVAEIERALRTLRCIVRIE